MKIAGVVACFFSLFGLAANSLSQPILSIDFDERGGLAGLTQPGFSQFLMGTAEGTGAQTNVATTLTFGAYTVTLSGNGVDSRYDDRQRNTPVNSGAFTQSALLRDVIFTPSLQPDAGLNVLVQGLSPNQVYRVTIWSFDSGSTGTPRVSDWDANGARVREDYAFAGATLPTSNTQYQFSFKVTASPAGEVLISGRRDSGSGNNPSVFINAFELEPSTPDLATATVEPAAVQVYTGDNVVFTGSIVGTAPYKLQWLKGAAPISNATNNVLTIFNAQPLDMAGYFLVVSNAAGVSTSAVATITAVLPVANLFSGYISHWPLDETSYGKTPDVLFNENDLHLMNLGPADLVAGQIGNALAFDGSTQLAARVHTNSVGLPIYNNPAYAVALWVKGDFTGQLDRRVFAESSTTNALTFLTIGTHNDAANGTVDIYIRNNDGVIPVNHKQSGRVAFDNTWHHIVWVDNNGYPTLYVDGVADTNDFNYRRGVLTPNNTSVGGILRATPSHWFAGEIDEVALWRRSLRASEVQQVFASGPPRLARLLGVEVAGGNVTLTFHTPVPANEHDVEEATDLEDPQWSDVQGIMFGGSGNTLTAQFPAPAGVQRFYRLRYSLTP